LNLQKELKSLLLNSKTHDCKMVLNIIQGGNM